MPETPPSLTVSDEKSLYRDVLSTASGQPLSDYYPSLDHTDLMI